MKTTTTSSLGPNAQIFADRVLLGIDAAGFEAERFHPLIVQCKRSGEPVFSVPQIADDVESIVFCHEDRLEYPDGTRILFSENFPPSAAAIMIVVSILTKNKEMIPEFE